MRIEHLPLTQRTESCSLDWSLTRITHSLDWNADGRQFGDLRLKHSDNARSLGYYAIPVAILRNGDGPTLLLTGGNHGDEFEGPAALFRLIHTLDITRLSGRLIVFPALNSPALSASKRCSPLDDGNLNRSFPGDRDGTPTLQIAHLIERVVLPVCDAAIDIHSGGRASEFSPLAMFNPGEDDLGKATRALTMAFGAPLVWVMGEHNDNRSLNGAALRARVPMFATELGGGGNVNRTLANFAYEGIHRVMHHLQMWSGEVCANDSPTQFVKTLAQGTVYAKQAGLFVPCVDLNDSVDTGSPIGTIYSIDEIDRPPSPVTALTAGRVIAMTHNGLVERGDLLLQLGTRVTSS